MMTIKMTIKRQQSQEKNDVHKDIEKESTQKQQIMKIHNVGFVLSEKLKLRFI